MNIYNRINGLTKIEIQRKKVNTAAHLDYDTAREYSWYLKKEERNTKKIIIIKTWRLLDIERKYHWIPETCFLPSPPLKTRIFLVRLYVEGRLCPPLIQRRRIPLTSQGNRNPCHCISLTFISMFRSEKGSVCVCGLMHTPLFKIVESMTHINAHS